MTSTIDVAELEAKVQEMYRAVAEQPHGGYHFEMGRPLAVRLGYPPEDLDRIPAESLESFAGVGYFFDLVALRAGESVLDLGSGSGTDSFLAALQVGPSGRVAGVDMTRAQLDKAERLRERAGLGRVSFTEGHIDHLPYDDREFDAVVSNGVINLAADKGRVFTEAARVLRLGGRLAIADILTDVELPQSIVCDPDLWAACIGGAAQRDLYVHAIESAGFRVHRVRENPYEFLSDSARGASVTYGVRSLCVLAHRVA
jgi:arsenite methyltransferase